MSGVIEKANGHTLIREFDVILWGATGWTGVHLLEYFIEKYPKPFHTNDHHVKWTVACRNEKKLQEVIKQQISTAAKNNMDVSWLETIPYIIADNQNEADVNAAVRRTKVVASVVGPFARYGELLVKQCAMHGTHYADITGEVQWVVAMREKYGEIAVKNKAIIICLCGADSVPSDIGTLTVINACNDHIKHRFHMNDEDLEKRILKSFTVQGFVTVNNKNNRDIASNGGGGTLASLLDLFESKETLRLFGDPFLLCPSDDKNSADEKHAPQVGFWRHPQLSSTPWTTHSIMATINEKVVRYSRYLLPKTFGTELSYVEASAFPYPGSAVVTSVFAYLLYPMLGFRPFRGLLRSVVPKQSQLPPPKPLEGQYKPGKYRMEFLCDARYVLSPHKKAEKEVFIKGKGSFELPDEVAWTETSKMLGEAALTLALSADNVRHFSGKEGGFLTPACMGLAYVHRLKHIGINIEAVAE